MKKSLRKHILREILKTPSRFVAIFAITALGAGFFAGLRATGPDMRATADTYYEETRLLDYRLLSTFGFTQDDVDLLRQREDIDVVMPTYGIDLLLEGEDGLSAARLHALPPDPTPENPEYLNQIELTQGRLPETAEECVADPDAGYTIGNTIRLSADNDEDSLDLMASREFTVVGLATSPYYISFNRGNTNIGNGTLDSYVYLHQSAFDSEYYTEIYLTASNVAGLSAFSAEYESHTDAAIDSLEAFGEERAAIRYEEIVAEARQEIDDGWKELEEARAEGQQELDDALKELQDAEKELADGRAELADGRKELNDAVQELNDAEKEIADAEAQLASGRAGLDAGRTQYNEGLAAWQQGYAEYETGLAAFNEQKATYDAAVAGVNSLREAAAGLQTAADGMAALLPVLATGTPAEQAVAAATFVATADSAANALAGVAEGLRQSGDAATADSLAAAATGVRDAANAGLWEQSYGTLAGALSGLNTALDATGAQLDAALPAIQQGGAELDAAKAQLDASKAQLDAAKAEIDSGRATLRSGEADLQTAREQLAEGRKEVASARIELQDAEKELADGELELADGKKEYEEGLAEFNTEIADAEQELQDAEQKLADLETPEWYVYGRDGNPGYAGFSSNADRISAIAVVIPYFFFLVAALVCLTTMTRMVEEQRVGIGTFKALGYSKAAIAAKFLLYAGVASSVGSLVGVIIGYYLFPAVIWNAYRMMYQMPSVVYTSQFWLALQSVGSMVLVTVGATFASCFGVLRSVPADLMRPRPPSKGTRVFLERVPFIWNRLKFSHKVTVRNLFRYKKRFFMTVIGVAGCSALLLTGFGLRDSISAVVHSQYGDVEHYDVILALKNGSSGAEETPLNDALQGLGNAAYIEQFSVEVQSGSANNSELTTYLFVAEDTAGLGEFISFNDSKGGEVLPYPEDGSVLLTQKLANRLNAGAGDTVQVNRANETPYAVQVAGVVENYVYHYVYMSPATYEEVTGEAPEYDRVLLRLAEGAPTPTVVLEQMIAIDNVAGGSDVATLQGEFDNMMGSMDSVVWLILVCAGLLAFVVLYNLTNINITERLREIATLKVLGFYEGEVASYVYRENLVLTLIGTAFGLVLGILLHRYVIATAEVDEVMFGRVIKPLSYLLSVAFTLVSAGVVNLVMLRKLRRIDMVESLKSAE